MHVLKLALCLLKSRNKWVKSQIQNVTKAYDTPKMLFSVDDCYISQNTHTQIYTYVKSGTSAVKKTGGRGE